MTYPLALLFLVIPTASLADAPLDAKVPVVPLAAGVTPTPVPVATSAPSATPAPTPVTRNPNGSVPAPVSTPAPSPLPLAAAAEMPIMERVAALNPAPTSQIYVPDSAEAIPPLQTSATTNGSVLGTAGQNQSDTSPKTAQELPAPVQQGQARVKFMDTSLSNQLLYATRSLSPELTKALYQTSLGLIVVGLAIVSVTLFARRKVSVQTPSGRLSNRAYTRYGSRTL